MTKLAEEASLSASAATTTSAALAMNARWVATLSRELMVAPGEASSPHMPSTPTSSRYHAQPTTVISRSTGRRWATLEVLSQGLSVTDVARRNGATRQTVHAWLRRYASHGLAGLADGSAKPFSCPHQTTPQVEARVVMIRREPPGWGQRTILHELGREGVVPLPTLSSIYRCLIRA